MKIDLLAAKSCAQGDQIQADHTSGQLNGIMIVGTASHLNKLTVKLRGEKQTYVLSNRLSCGFISSLTDIEQGSRARNSIGGLMANIIDHLATAQNGNTGGAMTTAFKEQYEEYFVGLAAIYLPLGFIDLKGKELEVVYDHGYSGTSDVRIYTVLHELSPEVYMQYDATKDLVTRMDAVRSIYIDSGYTLVDKDGVVKALDVQLDVDGEQTLLFDAQGMIAATKIFNRGETIEDDQYMKLYEETDALPSEVRCKLSYTDANLDPELIFMREIMPAEVSRSTVKNTEDMIRKVKTLERKDPDLAKRYRHAGAIPKSEELENVIKNVK
ncbi:MAG: hypothetical protein ABJO02_03370 [Reichenbachiella sp.]|uniref:hypothetical protein n=1 Tax=Reichenbachiella sp. TaxID=2184521 RepID=UPI00329A156F